MAGTTSGYTSVRPELTAKRIEKVSSPAHLDPVVLAEVARSGGVRVNGLASANLILVPHSAIPRLLSPECQNVICGRSLRCWVFGGSGPPECSAPGANASGWNRAKRPLSRVTRPGVDATRGDRPGRREHSTGWGLMGLPSLCTVDPRQGVLVGLVLRGLG